MQRLSVVLCYCRSILAAKTHSCANADRGKWSAFRCKLMHARHSLKLQYSSLSFSLSSKSRHEKFHLQWGVQAGRQFRGRRSPQCLLPLRGITPSNSLCSLLHRPSRERLRLFVQSNSRFSSVFRRLVKIQFSLLLLFLRFFSYFSVVYLAAGH